ncbi:MAG: SIMPL domain-containing protein [Candidatus Parcubacteria bacterium]|nr:SIMPL domain-containing protein [Candidatus Parcubacteria bacterium]
MNTFWPKIKENPIFAILLAILLAVLAVGLIFWARNLNKQNYYIGKNPQADRTIAISGEGKVTAIPDIASVTLGMDNTSMDIQVAQKKNSDAINALITQLKALGIAEQDIQTASYNIYPQYDYSNNTQIIKGYTVSQSVSVKVRQTAKVSNVLKIAGDLKLNQVGGLSFEVDQPEFYQQQAREKALQNAKDKAQALADVMGVKLGKVISFSESSNNYAPYPIYSDKSLGIGGGGTAPSVAPGSQDIIIDATIVYELD